MATSLGIYVDKNIIKYSKISKDKETIKVDAYGVELYSDLRTALRKIIEETYSYNVPISVNLTDENYDYFYMSTLLSSKDLKKAIKTEFDSYCFDHELNPNAIESRYALVNEVNEQEKLRVINVAIDKIKLNNLINKFEESKVTAITPLPLDIANIAPLDGKSNCAIVNIEDKTTVTIITGEKIYDIKKIDVGASQILDSINQKENSYQKAYESCKNTTIYTMEGRDLQSQDNEYLTYIIPTLYQIANELKEVIDNSPVKISKVYITGTGAVINNVDLYFEELLNNVRCEILRPFFIENSPKVNMKEYIEVNSAIALALQGLGYGIKEINFSKEKKSPFSVSIGGKKEGTSTPKKGILGKFNNFTIPDKTIGKFAKDCLIFAITIFVIYTTVSLFTHGQIKQKQKDLEVVKNDTNKQIELADKDLKLIQGKTIEYNTLTKKLQEASSQLSAKNSYKNMIPVLLSEITRIIPKEVQITKIENTEEKKIVINAQSSKYEQLAYFKAKIKSEGILKPSSVVSSEAVKENNTVKIVIEGELP